VSIGKERKIEGISNKMRDESSEMLTQNQMTYNSLALKHTVYLSMLHQLDQRFHRLETCSILLSLKDMEKSVDNQESKDCRTEDNSQRNAMRKLMDNSFHNTLMMMDKR
jgi:hypothetical protein